MPLTKGLAEYSRIIPPFIKGGLGGISWRWHEPRKIPLNPPLLKGEVVSLVYYRYLSASGVNTIILKIQGID